MTKIFPYHPPKRAQLRPKPEPRPVVVPQFVDREAVAQRQARKAEDAAIWRELRAEDRQHHADRQSYQQEFSERLHLRFVSYQAVLNEWQGRDWSGMRVQPEDTAAFNARVITEEEFTERDRVIVLSLVRASRKRGRTLCLCCNANMWVARGKSVCVVARIQFDEGTRDVDGDPVEWCFFLTMLCGACRQKTEQQIRKRLAFWLCDASLEETAKQRVTGYRVPLNLHDEDDD
jgi:hypothetical protein